MSERIRPAKLFETREPIPLESEKSAVRWWDQDLKLNSEVKWTRLEHNGVVFAPPYEPHGVQMRYDSI